MVGDQRALDRIKLSAGQWATRLRSWRGPWRPWSPTRKKKWKREKRAKKKFLLVPLHQNHSQKFGGRCNWREFFTDEVPPHARFDFSFFSHFKPPLPRSNFFLLHLSSSFQSPFSLFSQTLSTWRTKFTTVPLALIWVCDAPRLPSFPRGCDSAKYLAFVLLGLTWGLECPAEALA